MDLYLYKSAIIHKNIQDRRGEKEFDLDAVIALDDERRELL